MFVSVCLACVCVFYTVVMLCMAVYLHDIHTWRDSHLVLWLSIPLGSGGDEFQLYMCGVRTSASVGQSGGLFQPCTQLDTNTSQPISVRQMKLQPLKHLMAQGIYRLASICCSKLFCSEQSQCLFSSLFVHFSVCVRACVCVFVCVHTCVYVCEYHKSQVSSFFSI